MRARTVCAADRFQTMAFEALQSAEDFSMKTALGNKEKHKDA